jgi:hypothetical protein
MKILQVGAELFHADERKGRHDEANIRFHSQFCERAYTSKLKFQLCSCLSSALYQILVRQRCISPAGLVYRVPKSCTVATDVLSLSLQFLLLLANISTSSHAPLKLRLRRQSRIVGLHCVNGFMSPFWGLEFRGGINIFGTLENPWNKR